MNDTFRQLLSMAPALLSGMKGNPADASEFMAGWQEAEALYQQKERQKQHDGFALEDRQFARQARETQLTRQQTLDQQAAEDRKRRQALESLQIPGTLAALGGTAETPEDAQRVIESEMPQIMGAFGQDAMAYGMRAVDMATRTITGRQKKQVEAYVEQAMKTSYVSDNPEADPEMRLPDHLTRILGKPSAKLSELQSFAQLPIGKPAKRPSDDVSLQRQDMLVGGRLTPVNYNPKTGTYTDQTGNPVVVDSVPPRAPSNIDGRSPAAVATFNQIAGQYQRSPLTNASDRTIVLRDAAQAIREDPSNPSYQMALAYSYIQALDTYQSAVREGELQNLGSLGTMWQQLLVKANQVATSGAFMPPDVAQQIAEASDRLVQTIESGKAKKQAEFAARAKASGVGDLWSEFMAAIPTSGGSSTPPPSPNPASALPPMSPVSSRGATRPPSDQSARSGGRLPAAQLRERRKFGDELREWNGSRWVLVTPAKQ